MNDAKVRSEDEEKARKISEEIVRRVIKKYMNSKQKNLAEAIYCQLVTEGREICKENGINYKELEKGVIQILREEGFTKAASYLKRNVH